MQLFNVIDSIIKCIPYLCWGIAVACIPCSIALVVANVALGIASAALFVGALLLAVAVTLLLMPEKLAKGKLEGSKRLVVGGVLAVMAFIIVGVAYFATGGFPPVNLIFA